ncbi:MAG: hypothetical protein EPN21_02585 [Methylococcaceae bacterium]|nr:MAG: hypothetical protein EPN21_02585 [Methylococcaceae bacterium]
MNADAQHSATERLLHRLAVAYADVPEPDARRLAALEARLLAQLPCIRARRTRPWRWGGALLLAAGAAAAAWWTAPDWWPALQATVQSSVSSPPTQPPTATIHAERPQPAPPALPPPAAAPQPAQPQTDQQQHPSIIYRKEEY